MKLNDLYELFDGSFTVIVKDDMGNILFGTKSDSEVFLHYKDVTVMSISIQSTLLYGSLVVEVNALPFY